MTLRWPWWQLRVVVEAVEHVQGASVVGFCASAPGRRGGGMLRKQRARVMPQLATGPSRTAYPRPAFSVSASVRQAGSVVTVLQCPPGPPALPGGPVWPATGSKGAAQPATEARAATGSGARAKARAGRRGRGLGASGFNGRV